MDFQRLKTTFMGEFEFNNISGMLKTTYILEVILLYCTFFGLILCSNFNHPNSRFCCGPPWVVKNHLYIGGTAEIWEVFFTYSVITLNNQI